MAQPLFTNNAATTLASSITNVATTLTVASGTGALFPSPTGSNYSYVTLINAAGTVLEIVKLTARSTDTLTITRAQEGTIASAFSTGDKVELRVTAAGMTDTFNNGGVQSATAVAGTGISIGSVTTTGAATHTINNTGVTSVTVAAGTGMSGGGTVTTTGTVTLTNAGVTSVAAGTGISVSASTGGVTITNTAPSVTASVAKAWVNFAGSTGTINSSFNVSSITRNNTGYYTINFTTAMPNINYVVNVSPTTNGTVAAIYPCLYADATVSNVLIAPTTSAFVVSYSGYNFATRYDPTYCMLSVFSS